MKFNEILNEIKAQGGANITRELNIEHIKSGYMVSYENYEKIVNINDIDAIKDAINEKIEQLNEIKKTNHGGAVYFGAWVKDNKIFFDISANIQSKQRALAMGERERQYAIFDVKNGRDIPIECDVFILYKYIKSLDDFKYVKEYTKKIDILNDIQTSARALDYATINTLDAFSINKLLKDRYIIVKEKAYKRDVIY